VSGDRTGTFRAVAAAGLLAGTLDIVAACVNFMIATGGANPVIVLQYIASGVFGAAAFQHGPWFGLWGLFFHYVIAMSWTALFIALYPRLRLLRRSTIASGVVYGAVVWACMANIIVPLSIVRPVQQTFMKVLLAIAILIVCIGLPVAWRAGRHYARQQGDQSSRPAV
jgi:hypothetical protein